MANNTSSADAAPYSSWWPAIGATLGLAAAAYGLLERSPPAEPLPATAVARVNDTLIGSDRYRLNVQRLETATGSPLPVEERQRLVQQLVEEELLVQRGIELGMAETEATVRAAIVQSLLASVTAEADAANPSDAELEDYLQQNAENYTYATATAVRAWVADDEGPAQDFAATVRSATELDSELPPGIRAVPGLPTSALPPERLRMFLGPAIAAATLDMPNGSTAIYARQSRWYIVQVTEQAEARRAELAAVRSQVLVDYRRDLANDRLRDYLDGLLQRANVTLAPPP